MRVDGKPYRTVWVSDEDPTGRTIKVIDQRHLPHRFVVEDIRTPEEMATAISEMHVRGAGCIGACGAAGMWLAAVTAPREHAGDGRGQDNAASGQREGGGEEEEGEKTPFDAHMNAAAKMLMATRPTAVTLEHAVERCRESMRLCDADDREAKMLVRSTSAPLGLIELLACLGG
jgi:methylthioribose-1-phosphate isomerase